MKFQQLSIFLENKPGHLAKACHMLADANINVETMSLADTEHFGILRLLVRDWQRAKEVLEQRGSVVKVTEVIAVCVPNKPGGLVSLLEALSGTDINIEYMYGFNSALTEDAIIVLRLDKPDEAIEILNKKKVKVFDVDELFATK